MGGVPRAVRARRMADAGMTCGGLDLEVDAVDAWEKSEKASRISDSCAADMLCSFASLLGRGALGAATAALGGRRLGGLIPSYLLPLRSEQGQVLPSFSVISSKWARQT